jgi:tetratricopeptide (TPR) repeat protein
VKGAVVSSESLAGNRLVVSLIESTGHTQPFRANVAGDGSFEFRDVPPGLYTVELGQPGGESMETVTVSLNTSADRIEMRLPERPPAAPAGTVSVRQLQHPLPARSKKIFQAAEKASAAGDYLRQIEILRSALKDEAAAPYARMNIGVAYLRAGQAARAVPELQVAARLIPEDAAAHSNLAYSLLLTGRLEPAEAECRRALELNRNSAKARWVMGSILLNEGSHEAEAVEDLRFASREIPKARIVLAQFYERSGQKDAAVKELREYLPLASGQDRVNVERWLSNLNQ